MTFGHLMGVPVEETALALAPAWGGAVVLFAVRARSLRRRLHGWRRRRGERVKKGATASSS
jgi:hypothetical protein